LMAPRTSSIARRSAFFFWVRKLAGNKWWLNRCWENGYMMVIIMVYYWDIEDIE
jgi:hypothetical protein